MTFAIGLLLAIIILAALCFAFDWVSADVVALGVVLTLALTGLLPAQMVFAGFGSDTVIMTLGLLILTVSLVENGVIDFIGPRMVRMTGGHPRWLLLAVMLPVAALSSFISNTAATAFFVPIAISAAARVKVSPSRLLLPLAFASILASSTTLISTSTNLVVSALMETSGLAPLGMFELTPVGLPILLGGLIYMFFIGSRMIPERNEPAELIESFGVRPYLTEVLIPPNSSLIGKSLDESRLGGEVDVTILRVLRNKSDYLLPDGETVLQAGDVLLVEGATEEVLKIKDVRGIEIKADVKFSDPSIQGRDTVLVEAIIVPRSPLIGRTLKKSRFRDCYGLQVLAMNRHGKNLVRKISEVPLQMGDVLLLQGHRSDIGAIDGDPAFRILGQVGEKRFDRARALMAVGIFVSALLLAVMNVVTLPVAVLLGAFFTFLTKCISPERAYREVEWRVVILIACMLSLGAAMEATGTDKFLAGHLVNLAGNIGPVGLLGGFFILTVALTQPMSNQAAAAVIIPVAIESALQLGVNPRPFAIMVAVAASCSYLTPLEPSCLLVYGPGRYRFGDFVKVGAGVTLLVFAVAMILVPRLWPLNGQ